MKVVGPVELAALVAVAGSVLAAAVPAFVRKVHASRFAEPLDGLREIAGAAAAHAHGQNLEVAFPPSAKLTPAEVPQGRAVVDAPGIWDTPTWRALGFQPLNPHYYAFAFESKASATEASFAALAHGDLDGDGMLSTFSISGYLRPGEEPVVLPLFVEREIE